MCGDLPRSGDGGHDRASAASAGVSARVSIAASGRSGFGAGILPDSASTLRPNSLRTLTQAMAGHRGSYGSPVSRTRASEGAEWSRIAVGGPFPTAIRDQSAEGRDPGDYTMCGMWPNVIGEFVIRTV